MISRIVTRIGNTPFVRNAIAEKADLTAFKQKPSVRILLGVFLIGFSYIIGWPAVGALAGLAIYLEEPLVAIVGGPLTYGLSHLVFLAGMYLAGAKYSAYFFAVGDTGRYGKINAEIYVTGCRRCDLKKSQMISAASKFFSGSPSAKAAVK